MEKTKMGDKTKPELMEQQHEGINTQAAKEGPKQYYLKKPSKTSWVIGHMKLTYLPYIQKGNG